MEEVQPEIKKGLVFIIIGFSLLMSTMDATIVATALHTLQQELHTTVNWAGWTLTAFAFGFVLMLPVSAKLSVDYGHRRTFVFSIIVFTLASLCCGFSPNIYVLVCLRAIQAIGGAGITPSATGIIVEYFGKDRDRAVGLFGSIFPIGALIGPIFGGLFITYLNWRAIFFVNVPLGILVIFLAMKYIPKDRLQKLNSKVKTDFIGIIYMAIGLLSGMFAISYMGEKNSKFFTFQFLGLLMISIIFIILFLKHLRKSKQPFIEPRFISGKGFGAVNLVNTIYGGCVQGIIALVPLYATTQFGINVLDSGTLLVAQGVAAIAMSAAFAFLIRRTGYRVPIYLGVSIIVMGTLLLSSSPMLGIPPFTWLAGSTFLIGAGMGTISPASRNAGLQLVPDQSATLAALRSMGMQIGEILTISLATAIIASDDGLQTHIHAWIHLVVAFLFILCMPIIAKVPEHKGVW